MAIVSTPRQIARLLTICISDSERMADLIDDLLGSEAYPQLSDFESSFAQTLFDWLTEMNPNALDLIHKRISSPVPPPEPAKPETSDQQKIALLREALGILMESIFVPQDGLEGEQLEAYNQAGEALKATRTAKQESAAPEPQKPMGWRKALDVVICNAEQDQSQMSATFHENLKQAIAESRECLEWLNQTHEALQA